MPLVTIEAKSNSGAFRELRLAAKIRTNAAYYKNDTALQRKILEFENDLLALVNRYFPVHVATDEKLYDGNAKIFFTLNPQQPKYYPVPPLLFDPTELKRCSI